MQSVEIYLFGKWFEAINVSSHNIDGLLFCTIIYSKLAVENDLVSVDMLLPQDRVRWFAFAKKPISFEKIEQERIAAENAEAGKLLKESEMNVSEGDLLREMEKQVEESKIFSTLAENADAEESGSTTDKKTQQKEPSVVKSNTEQILHPESLTNLLKSEAPAKLSNKAAILPNSGRTQMTIDTIEEESYYFITKDLAEIKRAWEEADLGSLHDEDFKLYLNSKVFACELDPSDKTMNVRFGNHDTQWFPISCLYQECAQSGSLPNGKQKQDIEPCMLRHDQPGVYGEGKAEYKNQSGTWK